MFIGSIDLAETRWNGWKGGDFMKKHFGIAALLLLLAGGVVFANAVLAGKVCCGHPDAACCLLKK